VIRIRKGLLKNVNVSSVGIHAFEKTDSMMQTYGGDGFLDAITFNQTGNEIISHDQ
jgi:hypothetical protein